MDSYFRALCMTFVLASFTRRSSATGPVIKCEPCDVGARLLCKPLPKDCAEKVPEPGCGCCMSCALSFGQPCGVYTGRCGSGLSCQHQPGETKPLQALLEGRGICANASNRRPTVKPTRPANALPADNMETKDKEQDSTSSSLQMICGTHRPTGPLHTFFYSEKSEMFIREQLKKLLILKKEDLPGPLILDQQNFSLETKKEPEYGPCRREIESLLNSLKITNNLSPRGFRIPNCDKKGFYKKKQCHPSKGRKRGFCWCVDKYGQALPGFDGKERGDTLYYRSESQ